MARIVRFHRFGGPEVLEIDEIEVREPDEGEVAIKVGAIGLNRAEALFRAGNYGKPALPSMIGHEAAGTVQALGADVHDFAVGDRVATLPGISMEEYGTYGEVILFPAEFLVRLPANLSLEAAAATWMQYFTAYPLIDIAHLQPNDAVIITAASSSVGLAAIQIANTVGAIPIAVTRGRAKEEALIRQGAKHVVVTDEEDLAERVDRITGGRGARVIFDAVGGNLFPRLVRAAAPGGVVILYGALGGVAASLPSGETIAKQLAIHGFVATAITMDKARREAAIEFVLQGLASGALHPVIDQIFDFKEIAAAHRHLEGNEQIGKIIVRVR